MRNRTRYMPVESVGRVRSPQDLLVATDEILMHRLQWTIDGIAGGAGRPRYFPDTLKQACADKTDISLHMERFFQGEDSHLRAVIEIERQPGDAEAGNRWRR